MGWLLLMISGIGAGFAAGLRLLGRRPQEPRYRDSVGEDGPDTLEEDVREGELDVEDYKALHQPLQPTDNM